MDIQYQYQKLLQRCWVVLARGDDTNRILFDDIKHELIHAGIINIHGCDAIEAEKGNREKMHQFLFYFCRTDLAKTYWIFKDILLKGNLNWVVRELEKVEKELDIN